MNLNLIAIVRPPGESFRLAVSLNPERDLIDPERASLQHAGYVSTLRGVGVEVIELPPDEQHPDACFTQDPSVFLAGRLLVGRPGVNSRSGEAKTLEAAALPFVEAVEHMQAPATLEGGDVVRIGKKILVGRSTRTNDEGIEVLRRFAEPLGYSVHPVPVPRGVLHLSTAVTALHEELVFGLDKVVAHEAFDGMQRIPSGDAPLEANNLLVIGDEAIASGDYAVHDLLERAGIKVHRLNLSEFVRADAGPTCLSLLIERPPAAATR